MSLNLPEEKKIQSLETALTECRVRITAMEAEQQRSAEKRRDARAVKLARERTLAAQSSSSEA